MKVVTRFAPSPTGALHLGGARTALFSYLWAMHTKGTFLLRIEDTDTERSKDEHTQCILQSMQWLGLSWSEPLWYQSKRTDRYGIYIDKLLQSGHAYYCTCSPEEVEAMRERARAKGEQPRYDGTCREKGLPYQEGAVVRLKTPENVDLHIHDLIKGEIIINTRELDDIIICKSDGMPTYNLAVVVDDHEMGITHIIRGDDHIANTPKQLLLYQALDLPIPHFAHVPMILGSDKQKLSKRHGATAVIDYQSQGFLPQAMVNYLVRLGWSHGDQELFDLDTLIELFSIEALNPSPAAIDFDKLRWVNAHYIKTLPTETIVTAVMPFIYKKLDSLSITKAHASYRYAHCSSEAMMEALVHEIVIAFRERVQTLVELAEQCVYCFLHHTDIEFLPPRTAHDGQSLLSGAIQCLQNITIWNEDTLSQAIQEYIKDQAIENKHILPLLRFALTATKGGPDIPVILTLLGKEESILRLEQYLHKMMER